MGRFDLKSGKLGAAAKIAPFAIALAIFTLPAHSDISDNQPPMTFDSIGSMLQDMDREQSLAEAQDHPGIFAEEHTSGHACQNEDINAHMDEVYDRLRDQVTQFDLSRITQLETPTIVPRTHRMDTTTEERAALVREARASAIAVAADFRVMIAAAEEQRRELTSEEDVRAVKTHDLQAAGDALVNLP